MDGGSTVGEEWSLPANWEGGTAPTAPTGIGKLTFPRLTSTACTEFTEPCYLSWNDVSGLSAGSFQIDDGDTYFIGGEELALSGGLIAAPAAGAFGPAQDFIELPLRLTASQNWSVTAHGGTPGENLLSLESDITGSASGLDIDVANAAGVRLANDTEVGPAALEGVNSGVSGVRNGFAALLRGRLNSTDEHEVKLSHIFFFGSGEVGPLTTSAAELGVGISRYPAERIGAASVTLDPSSLIIFHITGHGATPGLDFSQLVSKGPVALGSANIAVTVAPPEKGQACPTFVPGQAFTFITTSGQLTGGFSNATESGTELPLSFSEACGTRSETMRISYRETGGTETVTGIIEADAKERAEARERQEASERQQASEREQAAERRASSGPPPSVDVLGISEVAPVAVLATKALTIGPTGRFTVRVKCAEGAGKCAGTVTLRTLHAVVADDTVPASRRSIATLAMASFDIPVGKEGTLILHLSKVGKRLLAHGHSLAARATIRVRNAAGAYITGQATVTLRASRARHG